MDNLEIYNLVREVPQEAQKTIKGGRLKGYTDINPMWRIKTLTERFGVVGVGWKYEIIRLWLEEGANGTKAAFATIELKFKTCEGWSEAIPGIGGSMFMSKESNGVYTDDECFKKAVTDAISVACKSLGVGADIYWSNDKSKYDVIPLEKSPPKTKNKANDKIDAASADAFNKSSNRKEVKVETTNKPESNKRRLYKAANGNVDIIQQVIEANGYKTFEAIPKKHIEKIIEDAKLAVENIKAVG